MTKKKAMPISVATIAPNARHTEIGAPLMRASPRRRVRVGLLPYSRSDPDLRILAVTRSIARGRRAGRIKRRRVTLAERPAAPKAACVLQRAAACVRWSPPRRSVRVSTADTTNGFSCREQIDQSGAKLCTSRIRNISLVHETIFAHAASPRIVSHGVLGRIRILSGPGTTRVNG
jgi:hypothetical protein